jgi:hypothetical protein
MTAHHTKRGLPGFANARRSPSDVCAVRLEQAPFGALPVHAPKTLSL